MAKFLYAGTSNGFEIIGSDDEEFSAAEVQAVAALRIARALEDGVEVMKRLEWAYAARSTDSEVD